MAPFLALTLALAAGYPDNQEPRHPAITWQEALDLAARRPEAIAARAAAEAQRELTPSGLGNPELSVSLGDRFGERSNPGFDGELSLIQPIPLAPVGSSRRQAVQAETRALDAQAANLTLDAKLTVAEAFALLHVAEQQLALREEERELTEQTIARIVQGKERGAYTARDVAQARQTAAEAKLDWLAAEAHAIEQGIQLARLIHLPDPVALRTSGGLPEVPLPPPAVRRALLAAVDRLPAVAWQALAASAASLRLRESDVEGGALQLGVGATVLREGRGDQAVLGTVTFGLPFFERNQRERGNRRAEYHQREGQVAESILDAKAFASRLLHDMEHAEEEARVYREELLPAASEGARLAEAAFQLGQIDFFDLAVSRRLLYEARSRERQAEVRSALARLRLALVLDALPAAEPSTSAPIQPGAAP